ncbi:MAG: desulfoferrodoxin family protein [bacterium]
MAERLSCEEDLFCGVNKAKDPGAMTDLEKKPTPVIEAPKTVRKNECFIVNIEVGKLLQHPNENGHFIQWLELYADETYLARMDFTAKTTCPKMTVCVSLDHAHGFLRVVERCNLHGLWEAVKQIKVE